MWKFRDLPPLRLARPIEKGDGILLRKTRRKCKGCRGCLRLQMLTKEGRRLSLMVCARCGMEPPPRIHYWQVTDPARWASLASGIERSAS